MQPIACVGMRFRHGFASVPDGDELINRLDTALAIVQRNLADAVDPIATASSEVHRLVAAAPEHSKVRAAFAQMEKRWQETFKGGRPTKAADDATAPAATPTKPA